MGLKVWNCGFDTLSQEIYKSSKCFNDIFDIIVIVFCTIISHGTLNNLWYFFHRSRCVWRTSKRWVHLRAGASLKDFRLRARLGFRFGAWALPKLYQTVQWACRAHESLIIYQFWWSRQSCLMQLFTKAQFGPIETWLVLDSVIQ